VQDEITRSVRKKRREEKEVEREENVGKGKMVREARG